MELITAYAIYMTGAILLVGMFALRAPYENLRTVFALALMWPLSIAAILGMVILTTTGWNLDVARGSKMFGFRRPNNPNAQGFAVTVFYGEVQVWKTRKA